MASFIHSNFWRSLGRDAHSDRIPSQIIAGTTLFPVHQSAINLESGISGPFASMTSSDVSSFFAEIAAAAADQAEAFGATLADDLKDLKAAVGKASKAAEAGDGKILDNIDREISEALSRVLNSQEIREVAHLSETIAGQRDAILPFWDVAPVESEIQRLGKAKSCIQASRQGLAKLREETQKLRELVVHSRNKADSLAVGIRLVQELSAGLQKRPVGSLDATAVNANGRALERLLTVLSPFLFAPPEVLSGGTGMAIRIITNDEEEDIRKAAECAFIGKFGDTDSDVDIDADGTPDSGTDAWSTTPPPAPQPPAALKMKIAGPLPSRERFEEWLSLNTSLDD